MLTFRPKLGSENDREWRCCFCLHVRTGCILLGSWHLILHFIALGFLAAIVRDPNLLEELERDAVGDWRPLGDPLPTPLSNVEARPSPHPQYGPLPRDHSLIYHDVDMGALVTVCTLAITLMLIYGAARGKPAHLLPFFCLQLFDFAITVLTAMGYLCYLRTIRGLVEDAHRVPWREQLLALPTPALAFVVLCAFLIAVAVKSYWLGVVWRCYKYLTMRTHALQQLTPFVISGEPAPPTPYRSLLPDYEEAIKQTPPPSYRAATLMAAADPTRTQANRIVSVTERCYILLLIWAVCLYRLKQIPAAEEPLAPPSPQGPSQPSVPTNTVVMLPQAKMDAQV